MNERKRLIFRLMSNDGLEAIKEALSDADEWLKQYPNDWGVRMACNTGERMREALEGITLEQKGQNIEAWQLE